MLLFSWTCNNPGFTTSSLYLNQSITPCSDKSFNFTDITPTTHHQFNKRLKYQTASQESALAPAPPQAAENSHWWATDRGHTQACKESWQAHHSSAVGWHVPSCMHIHEITPSSAHHLCQGYYRLWYPNEASQRHLHLKTQHRSHRTHLPFWSTNWHCIASTSCLCLKQISSASHS